MELSGAAIVFAVAYLLGLCVGYCFGRMHGRLPPLASEVAVNWFRWLQCWFNRRHVFTHFRRADGSPALRCIRCG